ncbi:tas protein [Yellow-breasted capuchin simian foamy virus]|uniref:Tas protein n=1 Tax=Yellow-breasted capuchin simian foamy virus TaxID=2170206 RepID=A0A0G3Y3E1_9RETR|nr:tas protein [Yellow-breasted capuchin simian foamy virus]AKM21187.1 tas protein [Yellow-breasted capuchin simian foamy virus]
MAAQQEETELKEFLAEFPFNDPDDDLWVPVNIPPAPFQPYADPHDEEEGEYLLPKEQVFTTPSEAETSERDDPLPGTSTTINEPTGEEPKFKWLQVARRETDYDRFDLGRFFPDRLQREFILQRAILTAAGYQPTLVEHCAKMGWYACLQPHHGALGETTEVYYKCLKCGSEQWDPLLYIWDKHMLMFKRAWTRTPHTSSPLSNLRRHDAICPGLNPLLPHSSTEPLLRKPRRDPGDRWRERKRKISRGGPTAVLPADTFTYASEWPQPERMHSGGLGTVPILVQTMQSKCARFEMETLQNRGIV